MTVHGAKGLEAPVVILPDTGPKARGGPGLRLVRAGRTRLLADVAGRRSATGCAALDARRTGTRAERNRLLYVALTRAESWLIVAAAGPCPTTRRSGLRPGTARSKRACMIGAPLR
jgi:ATP-dependent helicase/nuclease subunit A